MRWSRSHVYTVRSLRKLRGLRARLETRPESEWMELGSGDRTVGEKSENPLLVTMLPRPFCDHTHRTAGVRGSSGLSSAVLPGEGVWEQHDGGDPRDQGRAGAAHVEDAEGIR